MLGRLAARRRSSRREPTKRRRAENSPAYAAPNLGIAGRSSTGRNDLQAASPNRGEAGLTLSPPGRVGNYRRDHGPIKGTRICRESSLGEDRRRGLSSLRHIEFVYSARTNPDVDSDDDRDDHSDDDGHCNDDAVAHGYGDSGGLTDGHIHSPRDADHRDHAGSHADAVAFVISANVHRRHLTPGQKPTRGTGGTRPRPGRGGLHPAVDRSRELRSFFRTSVNCSIEPIVELQGLSPCRRRLGTAFGSPCPGRSLRGKSSHPDLVATLDSAWERRRHRGRRTDGSHRDHAFSTTRRGGTTGFTERWSTCRRARVGIRLLVGPRMARSSGSTSASARPTARLAMATVETGWKRPALVTQPRSVRWDRRRTSRVQLRQRPVDGDRLAAAD